MTMPPSSPHSIFLSYRQILTRLRARRLVAGVLAAALALSLAGAPLAAAIAASDDAAIPVTVVKSGDGFQLLRGGVPFVVKGAAGGGSLAALAALGGNTDRTWDSGNIAPLMAEAKANKMAIITGVWLGQVRQGFKWSDDAAVQGAVAHTLEQVKLWKDHPSTLVWDLGNEMESMGGPDDIDVWKGIEKIAKAVKDLDPNHPTMTTVAEIGGDKVANIHKYCPDIDIVGINSYGGGPSLPARYRKAGGVKPFMITEYGPPGVWEIGKDAFGAADEPTSTAKADLYARTYTAAAEDHLCLGSVAFTWGNKTEATLTWFGLLLRDGSRLEAADRLSTLWGGTVANHCPTIEPISITEGAGTVFKPGDTIHATIAAKDPAGDTLTAKWMLCNEAMNFDTGGDKQMEPPSFTDAITASDAGSATVKLPAGGGLYRLYVFITDGKGGGATANVVLKIDGPMVAPPAPKPTLPVTFIGDDAHKLWADSGYMGDETTRAGIHMDQASTVQPHSGATCLRVELPADKGWGGVFWQNPANDWGKVNGGFDLTGAKKMIFWARGDQGGEVVTFGYGGLKKGEFKDSASDEKTITLTKDWTEYSFDVTSKDLSRIKSGFRWSAKLKGEAVVFYVDDARWE